MTAPGHRQHPGAHPIDGIDNDHDGEIDEGFLRCIFHVEGPGDICNGRRDPVRERCVTCVNPRGDDASSTTRLKRSRRALQ